MEPEWYFRLFYFPILNSAVGFSLAWLIKAKRMGAPEGGKFWMIGSTISVLVFIALGWFVSFSISPAFWIGLAIILLGYVVFALCCSAMREHPEKKQAVIDWGIFKITRHSHVISGRIMTLGVVVMGWNWGSIMYIILWVYFVLDFVFSYFYILMEEKRNVEKFGQEYVDYMKRTPRWIGIPKSKSLAEG
jgi:protein-S-isoprenylcysteine O-methyltransferase Ste14